MLLSALLFGALFAAGSRGQTPTYVESDVPTGVAIPGNYNGALRPQIHYSPPQNFMNDPNGMFLDEDGLYHLYYQYNPTGLVAGNQHWGHASSRDLYHWENHPIALFPGAANEAIFSGSAVVDVNNTSGFFPDQRNGVIAIYTVNTITDHGEVQDQHIAYSTDGGYSFTKYSANPVLTTDGTNFRDPQVTWHSETESWVMMVAYATDLTVGIFTSSNLKDWSWTSNFTHPVLNRYQAAECPNLILTPVEGTDEMMYVLVISVNPGAPLGGSITTYFPGFFNGTAFTAVDGAARIADFAKDSYAAQWFFGLPEKSSPVSLAWTSNWQYTNVVPTGQLEGWRSSMSLPRVNTLKNVTRLGWDLISKPYDMTLLQTTPLAVDQWRGDGALLADFSSVESGAIYFQANFSGPLTGATNFTFFSSVSGESIQGGFYGGQFWLDRGQTRGFENPFFTDKFSTSVIASDGTWTLEGVLDRSLFEVFLNDGADSATMSFFPEHPLDTMIITTVDLSAETTVSVAAWGLTSAWAGQANANGIVVGSVTASASAAAPNCQRLTSMSSIAGRISVMLDSSKNVRC